MLTLSDFEALPEESVQGATLVHRLWHLLDALRPALERDFAACTGPYQILEAIHDRPQTVVHPSAIGIQPEQIYIAPHAAVHAGAVLNAEDGPIYIDRNAKVLEQAVLRGPLYVGPKTQVKVGANIGTCAIGPWCKVGGEVHDTVMHSLSNKSHAGFLGHSYLGRWCNLGAHTNVSNLKNDYGEIALYNPVLEKNEPTGRQFVGCFMGDHSKTAINTMLNTGTLIGTSCNLFGADFPPRGLPSFTWGSPGDYTGYRLEKALRVAETVMARRDTPLTEADRALLTHVFEMTRDVRATVHAAA
jgi:UDP-N-acetylglucosamine diphosphorylase/glucosamine-1-phosphate N-acetyltransferase